jgi:tetratricopeptide (TPR) repeat protein
LLLLSCAPHAPSTNNATTSAPSIQDAPPYGDDIDDAAWEALGPRPANAARLPYHAMRLVDFWVVDEPERRARTAQAQTWTRAAAESEAKHSITRLDLYLDAIRLAPLYLPAWPQACRVLINRNEIARAHALAQQYARLTPPGDGMPQYILGKCEAHLGNPEQALVLLQKAATSPTTIHTDVITAMALVQLQLGNLHAAESLQTIYDIREPSLDLLIRSRRARRNGDLMQATNLLQEATVAPGAPAGIWEELASVYLAQEAFDPAARAYRMALAETPQRTAPRIGLARVEQARGDYDAAEGTLQEVLRDAPDNLTARFNLAAVYLERARNHRTPSATAANDLMHAVAMWSRCIEEDFRTTAALWGRAEARLWLGDLTAAQSDVARLHGDSYERAVHTRWASLLISTGNKSIALEVLHAAERQHELDAAGRSLLGQLEPKPGYKIWVLRQVFQENPQDSATGMRLGVALLEEGELAEAEEVMRAVVLLRPDDPDAFQNLAAVLDRRKKYREAQAAMQQADKLR